MSATSRIYLSFEGKKYVIRGIRDDRPIEAKRVYYKGSKVFFLDRDGNPRCNVSGRHYYSYTSINQTYLYYAEVLAELGVLPKGAVATLKKQREEAWAAIHKAELAKEVERYLAELDIPLLPAQAERLRAYKRKGIK